VNEEYPEYGATDVVGYPVIAVAFREDMDNSSINKSTIILQDGAGNQTSGSVMYNEFTLCTLYGCADYYYLVFHPSSHLAPGNKYTLTITGDVKYENGNALGHDHSYSFTTMPDLGTGTWEDISIVNAPLWSSGDTAIWTGTEMIVWGAQGGGRYNPTTDTWQPMSTTNAPLWSSGDTAIWTGTEMIVWGGQSGGRYNPTTDTWQPMSTTNAPWPRRSHTAIWTGTEMIVWGGGSAQPMIRSGGKYSPSTDSWQETSPLGPPSGRYYHTAIWTGTEMIVWGGDCDYYDDCSSGGIYDPVTDSWRATSFIGVPEGRSLHTAVWTGTEMIVWGGQNRNLHIFSQLYETVYLHTGGSYDPDTDNWQPTSTTGSPSMKSSHVEVWTGTEMIVWNGTGSKYLP